MLYKSIKGSMIKNNTRVRKGRTNMRTVYREKKCYIATVIWSYYNSFAEPSRKVLRLISDSEDKAREYVKKYFSERSHKIIDMRLESVPVLDLTDEIEYVNGTIGGNGSGKRRRHPDLDMYDRRRWL